MRRRGEEGGGGKALMERRNAGRRKRTWCPPMYKCGPPVNVPLTFNNSIVKVFI